MERKKSGFFLVLDVFVNLFAVDGDFFGRLYRKFYFTALNAADDDFDVVIDYD